MSRHRDSGTPRRAERRERGGVLAEFALLSFVIWLLLAGVLEIGRALTAQQLIQHAARTLAREAAQLELPAELSFDQAAQTEAFRSNVLDTRFLVIDSGLLARCGYADFGRPGHDADLNALFDTLPIGNRLLRPLMIADERGAMRMIRYPGALLVRNTAPGPTCGDGSLYTVGIARVDPAAGVVRWSPVVEEQTTAGGGRTGYALSEGGWVGLRLSYPFQSAGLLAATSTGVVDPRTGRETQQLIDADGVLLDRDLDRLDATLAPSDRDAGVYAGLRGLGRLYAMSDASGNARVVRPFRRVLSAHAGFRREIFLEPAGGAP